MALFSCRWPDYCRLAGRGGLSLARGGPRPYLAYLPLSLELDLLVVFVLTLAARGPLAAVNVEVYGQTHQQEDSQDCEHTDQGDLQCV